MTTSSSSNSTSNSRNPKNKSKADCIPQRPRRVASRPGSVCEEEPSWHELDMDQYQNHEQHQDQSQSQKNQQQQQHQEPPKLSESLLWMEQKLGSIAIENATSTHHDASFLQSKKKANQKTEFPAPENTFDDGICLDNCELYNEESSDLSSTFDLEGRTLSFSTQDNNSTTKNSSTNNTDGHSSGVSSYLTGDDLDSTIASIHNHTFDRKTLIRSTMKEESEEEDTEEDDSGNRRDCDCQDNKTNQKESNTRNKTFCSDPDEQDETTVDYTLDEEKQRQKKQQQPPPLPIREQEMTDNTSSSTITIIDEETKARERPNLVSASKPIDFNDDSPQNKILIERYRLIEQGWEYNNGHNPKAIKSLCTPDFQSHFMGPDRVVQASWSIDDLVHGMQGMMQACPNLRFMYRAIEESLEQPGVLIVHDFVGTGRHTGTDFQFLPTLPPIPARGHSFVLDPMESHYHFTTDPSTGRQIMVKEEVIALGQYTGPGGIYALLAQAAAAEMQDAHDKDKD